MADVSTSAKGSGRDLFIILAAVVAAVVVAWIYIVNQARGMSGIGTLEAWTAVDLLLLFMMWTIMMIGMMLPSAVPLFLNFTAETRLKHKDKGAIAPATALALGFIVVWTGFSVVATIIQYYRSVS